MRFTYLWIFFTSFYVCMYLLGGIKLYRLSEVEQNLTVGLPSLGSPRIKVSRAGKY